LYPVVALVDVTIEALNAVHVGVPVPTGIIIRESELGLVALTDMSWREAGVAEFRAVMFPIVGYAL
jgi:hypothetical protein